MFNSNRTLSRTITILVLLALLAGSSHASHYDSACAEKKTELTKEAEESLTISYATSLCNSLKGHFSGNRLSVKAEAGADANALEAYRKASALLIENGASFDSACSEFGKSKDYFAASKTLEEFSRLVNSYDETVASALNLNNALLSQASNSYAKAKQWGAEFTPEENLGKDFEELKAILHSDQSKALYQEACSSQDLYSQGLVSQRLRIECAMLSNGLKLRELSSFKSSTDQTVREEAELLLAEYEKDQPSLEFLDLVLAGLENSKSYDEEGGLIGDVACSLVQCKDRSAWGSIGKVLAAFSSPAINTLSSLAFGVVKSLSFSKKCNKTYYYRSLAQFKKTIAREKARFSSLVVGLGSGRAVEPFNHFAGPGESYASRFSSFLSKLDDDFREASDNKALVEREFYLMRQEARALLESGMKPSDLELKLSLKLEGIGRIASDSFLYGNDLNSLRKELASLESRNAGLEECRNSKTTGCFGKVLSMQKQHLREMSVVLGKAKAFNSTRQDGLVASCEARLASLPLQSPDFNESSVELIELNSAASAKEFKEDLERLNHHRQVFKSTASREEKLSACLESIEAYDEVVRFSTAAGEKQALTRSRLEECSFDLQDLTSKASADGFNVKRYEEFLKSSGKNQASAVEAFLEGCSNSLKSLKSYILGSKLYRETNAMLDVAKPYIERLETGSGLDGLVGSLSDSELYSLQENAFAIKSMSFEGLDLNSVGSLKELNARLKEFRAKTEHYSIELYPEDLNALLEDEHLNGEPRAELKETARELLAAQSSLGKYLNSLKPLKHSNSLESLKSSLEEKGRLLSEALLEDDVSLALDLGKEVRQLTDEKEVQRALELDLKTGLSDYSKKHAQALKRVKNSKLYSLLEEASKALNSSVEGNYQPPLSIELVDEIRDRLDSFNGIAEAANTAKELTGSGKPLAALEIVSGLEDVDEFEGYLSSSEVEVLEGLELMKGQAVLWLNKAVEKAKGSESTEVLTQLKAAKQALDEGRLVDSINESRALTVVPEGAHNETAGLALLFENWQVIGIMLTLVVVAGLAVKGRKKEQLEPVLRKLYRKPVE